jgi:3-oxoacyl-[acyl-carrier-protein] synthase III
MNSDIVNYAMKNLQQGQTIVYDTVRFTAYSDAVVLKEQNLSNFYYERFRPEMRAAVDAWLKTDPFNNKTAPPTPFFMNEYNKTFALEAQQFANDSQTKLEEAHQAAKHSEDYLMLTVVYSSALFIGAIIEKLFHRQGRFILFILATGITGAATIILAFMPIGSNGF